MLHKDQVKQLNEKLTREFGQTIMDRLADDAVVEIMLNPDGLLWEDRLGVGMACIGELSPVFAESAIGTVAVLSGLEVGPAKPILEVELPEQFRFARFEALLPPVAAKPVFTIRKRASVIFTLDEYITRGILDADKAEILRDAVRSRKNILVAGGTGSGKTTLLNALLHEMAMNCGDDRVVIMEDTPELQCAAKNAVFLRTAGDIDMTRLLKATMRLRPDRIILGEVRDGAALAMLKAWNTGHPGGLCTVHANSATAALVRIGQLIQEANVPPQDALIDEAVDVVVFITKTKEGKRKVEEVVQRQR